MPNTTTTLHTLAHASLAAAAVPAFADNLGAGAICAANESRFDQAYMSVPLTTFASGWRDTSPLEETLEFLAPDVPNSPERFTYRQWVNAEEFLADTLAGFDDIRAIGSDFKKVEYQTSEVHEKMDNKGLTYIEETRTLTANPDRRNQIVAKLLRRLLRNDLYRAQGVLFAAATNTSKTWGNTSDPDSDLLALIKTSADASGVRPTRTFIGDGAWVARLQALRSQLTAGSLASSQKTPAELGAWLRTAVLVGESRYTATAASKAVIGNNIVLTYTAESGLDREDPSNIKRFSCPCDDGSRYRVFEQQLGPKLTAITVEHYSKIVVCSTVGVQALTIANAA